MGAWYALSAIGLYQMEGGKDEVILGSPSVVGAELTLPKGKKLSIKTHGQSEKAVFVQSVNWAPTEGKEREITENVIPFTELMSGGRLTFSMGTSSSRKNAL